MKFIFTADWHIKLWQDKIIENGIPKRLKEILDTIDYICRYAIENKIQYIFIGGDTNDLKGIIHTKAFVLLHQILNKYSSNLKFIFLHGNHDSPLDHNDLSAISLLKGKNIIPILNDTIIDNITLIPFHKNIKERIKLADSNDILISHFGLNEAQISSGISIRSSITVNDLTKFKLVLLGHYHNPQNCDNWWYSGSLIPLRSDERNSNKRFLIVDSDTLEVNSIPIEGYRKYYEFIITDENYENIDNILEEAKLLLSEGNYVTVKKKIKIDNKYNTNDINIIDEVNKDITLRGITTSMSVIDQIKKYLEIEGYTEDEVIKYCEFLIPIINQ